MPNPIKDPRGIAFVIVGLVVWLVLECLALAYEADNEPLWTVVAVVGIGALIAAMVKYLRELRRLS